MKLGAQFYTIRTETQTVEGLDRSFAKIKEIGYETVQLSAIGPIGADDILRIRDRYEMPIVCTHVPFDRIVNDTDALIREHKLYGCETIGLGAMPFDAWYDYDRAVAFASSLREPIAKIRDAGLRFAYHNHSFEFVDYGGKCSWDVLRSELPDMDYILDVFWLTYAGVDPIKTIREIGAEHIRNIHYKDMKSAPAVFGGDMAEGAKLICPCGEGIIDFSAITKVCDELGIPNALVEQDNAPELGDVFAQMKTSYDHLRPIIG